MNPGIQAGGSGGRTPPPRVDGKNLEQYPTYFAQLHGEKSCLVRRRFLDALEKVLECAGQKQREERQEEQKEKRWTRYTIASVVYMFCLQCFTLFCFCDR